MTQKKELEIALTSYIALQHNQDECSGFIDGFKEALEQHTNIKAKTAIGFAEWLIYSTDIEYIEGEGFVYFYKYPNRMVAEKCTTSELFTIYINQL